MARAHLAIIDRPAARKSGIVEPLLVLFAIIGCSTADRLPHSDGARETDDDDTAPPPTDSADSTDGGDQSPPPEYGDRCGLDVIGWETACSAWSTRRSYSDPIQMTTVDVEDELAADFATL